MDITKFKFYDFSKSTVSGVSASSDRASDACLSLNEAASHQKLTMGIPYHTPRRQQHVETVPGYDIMHKTANTRPHVAIKKSTTKPKYQIYSAHLNMCESM